jgi:predicted transcriptional regulator
MGREEIDLTVEDRGSGDSLLMNDRRRMVFQEVAARPCLHLRQVARRLESSAQSVAWHLRRLVAEGYLSVTPWRGRSAHYPDRLVLPRDVPVLAALRRELTAKVYGVIRREPGIRQVDLAEAAGTYQQVILLHLKDLQSLHLIRRRRRGKATRYYPTELLADLIGDYAAREAAYADWLVGLLEADHLLPRVVSRRRGVLRVTVNPGSMEVEMSFPLNPARTL